MFIKVVGTCLNIIEISMNFNDLWILRNFICPISFLGGGDVNCVPFRLMFRCSTC